MRRAFLLSAFAVLLSFGYSGGKVLANAPDEDQRRRHVREPILDERLQESHAQVTGMALRSTLGDENCRIQCGKDLPGLGEKDFAGFGEYD